MYSRTLVVAHSEHVPVLYRFGTLHMLPMLSHSFSGTRVVTVLHVLYALCVFTSAQGAWWKAHVAPPPSSNETTLSTSTQEQPLLNSRPVLRVVVVAIPEHGHLSSIHGLILELSQRGHMVTFASLGTVTSTEIATSVNE